MGAESQEVWRVGDFRELCQAEELYGDCPLVRRHVELDVLNEAGEVRHEQHRFVFIAPDESQHFAVFRVQELDRASRKGFVAFAQGDQASRPPEQRVRVALLRLHVDSGVVVFRIGDHRQIEALRVGQREPGVTVTAPLHRRAHTVAVAEIDVVAHANLVAVIDYRRPRQREEQPIHQLNAPAIVVQERSQPPAYAQVHSGLPVLSVDAVHVVAVLVGDHFEGQLVVIAQEDRPLAALRDRRRLLEDIDDREAVLHVNCHEEPRHQREMEGHVALVA